ncbi:MAG: hypothetical protein SFV81_30590, partial [Pirellulaceae bacterium]|nr:hypothetical protein [Pirellulaceae bacterium]
MNSLPELIPVAECVKHFESTKHTENTEVAAESLDGFRYRSRWCGLWIGAAFVPLMFLAGILILVETKKGRLVIESEVAGVNVTLLRDGEIYDELKLEPGTNSTTLLAGQYKIVVDDAKDIVLLDGGKIEIKRGDVVVARVRPEPKQLTEAEFENVEPIYDGKGVGEWLDIVARERNATKARTALVAVKSLLNPENAPLISKRLVQVMATLSDDLAQSRAVIETSSVPQRGTTQSVRYSSTMDEL